MAGESKDDVVDSATSRDTGIKRTKKKKGALSRLWSTIFRVDNVDFEKRLRYISQAEAAVLSRIRRRAQRRRGITRQLLMFSVLTEVIAVSYAIVTTRSLDLNWRMRALRVLPMFLLPALSSFTYSALSSYTRMRDQKDNKTLEKLRDERQERINQLKEKTNYYATQQLIQRYDPDPASKAAAATVLASKLGSESGLKLYVGDKSYVSAPTAKSNDLDISRTTGLRNRKPSQLQIGNMETTSPRHPEEILSPATFGGADMFEQQQLVVEHHPQTGLNINDGGWIARIAALLVGEDPTQSYAVICENCHMHNGLARKEDFPYITYYCPHCNALNRRKQPGELASDPDSPTVASLNTMGDTEVAANAGGSRFDTIAPIASPIATAAEGISES